MDDKLVASEKFNQIPQTIKDIYVYDPAISYETFQAFYLDQSRRRIRPNVVILNADGESILFETNALGFKGPEIEPSKKLAVVWGDSVVFAHFEGWVDGISQRFPDYQFVNGGLEGDRLENIVNRAVEKNEELAIDRNIIFPGWHSLKNPERIYELLNHAADALPGVILCTVPTSLCEKAVSNDISEYLTEFKSINELEDIYLFWGNLEYTIDNAKLLYKRLLIQNNICRKVAKEKSLPLVDLYQPFHQNDLERFREYFFDVGHPRPSAYAKFQDAFYEELKDVL